MELITKLEQFGLSKREAEVYIALLQKKEFTAPELTKITTITRTKIYEHLQNLMRKGLCNENIKNGQKIYTAVSPKIVLSNIVRHYELEVEQKKQAAVLLEKELVQLHSDNKDNSDPLDYIEVLTDSGQIRERWFNIQNNTKKELLVFTKPPYTQSLEADIDDETELLKSQKINVKSIYEYKSLTTKNDKDNLIEIIEICEKMGEQAKVIEELPMKLVISDKSIAMFALNDRISLKPSITTMIVDHPSFAVALTKVFESYWASAISVEQFKNLEIV